uniref:RING-type E3 ubiquitin transferase n=3 Tax=Rhizophora mucronata TaxID=61149 RepID=A0A2P2JS06_RHIMU
MAVVSPAPAIVQQQESSVSLQEVRVPESADSSTNMVTEEQVSRVIEEKMYVAVGKSVKKCQSVLVWALQNSGGKRICILHVHRPAEYIPCMGAKFPASTFKEEEVLAYQEIKRQEMRKSLDEYLGICQRMGVRAEKLYTEMESIEKGILELISQHRIRKLVIGAAADKCYSRNMMDIKSKKAMSLCTQAPPFCNIWFVCKGHLIHQREGNLEIPCIEVGSSSQQASPNAEIRESSGPRFCPIVPRQNSFVKLTNPAQDLFRRVKSANSDGRRGKVTTTKSLDIGGLSTPCSRSDADGSSDECDLSSRSSTSHGSVLSSCSDSGMVGFAKIRSNGVEEMEDGRMEDPLDDQLKQAMKDAANSREEVYEEKIRCAKAQKEAIEAIRRARASECLYNEESKQRKEIEDLLAKEKDKLGKMIDEQNRAMKELCTLSDQKSMLESQVTESDQMAGELEQKIVSAVELLQNYKKERDELQMERDNALIEAEELRKCRVEDANTPQFFTEFSFSEIEEATCNFDLTLRIGEGGYGSIYRGTLCHTVVAIKVLHSHSLQGPSEFQQEVDILSKMRHPNIVTLIGACPEAWALIYEYLPNGSLEDRLSCRDNSPPLSWQTRIRIATELCSALIFLQSNRPHSIVHGDLKPANILLDRNFVSKLSDFGISRLLSWNDGSSTIFCKTEPKGTFAYMDPEFLSSGELTPLSDVYSFGIILLRLLTGRPALGIMNEVRYALHKGNLEHVLDPLAGDWPFVLAEQLAHLALRCCETNRKCRPDLTSEVWRVLEPMKASCGGSWCSQLGLKEHCELPPYFICPIFQEVMQDPHVAADGFTYEAEAIRGWLDSGHDTSPMTNLKLEHCNLVPNHALRSAIQEWLHQK